MKYLDVFVKGYEQYATFLWSQITTPNAEHFFYQNYFYLLIILSLFFWGWEIVRPWRKNQGKFRKDFWLDAFYMFFNFFIFSLLIYSAASDVVVELFKDGLAMIGIKNLVAIEVKTWPIWAHLLVTFFVRDFVQWWTHRLLHRSSTLWEFHKVHHSVEEMGFAAHLRFHWMETLVYSTIQYIPLAMMGIGLNEFFIVYALTTMVGHFNHSNINLPLGPLKYVFNNPQMHIWHHVKTLPEDHQSGVNFGLTLSCWDYIFGTAYIPSDGRDIELGFDDLESYPKGFFGQFISGFRKQ